LVLLDTVWLSTKEEVTEAVTLAYSKFSSKLKMPIYGAIGNHDVHPTNSFPRANSNKPHESDWTFSLHSNFWKSAIGSEEADRSKTHNSGSYSVVHPKSNLRLISFNSGYAYKAVGCYAYYHANAYSLWRFPQNFWLYDSDNYSPDPNGLFAWLVGELQAAESAGQKAWIFAHMSTGKSDFMQDQSAMFDQIVQRYQKTVSN